MHAMRKEGLGQRRMREEAEKARCKNERKTSKI
jgi:hypothetical protein